VPPAVWKFIAKPSEQVLLGMAVSHVMVTWVNIEKACVTLISALMYRLVLSTVESGTSCNTPEDTTPLPLSVYAGKDVIGVEKDVTVVVRADKNEF
jgi:hypothetical protein